VENLRDGYGLKLTIARYYTPSGKSIQATGIEPDIYLSYRILDEEALNQERQLKEKDLMNHLGAEPGTIPEDKAREEDPKQQKTEKKNQEMKREQLRGGETRYGELEPAELQKDNQIVRGLEILVSYDIFKIIEK
jgi:carboxyl-terminal processing protease